LDRKIEGDHKISGQTKLRVRYAETDKMGVVYHSNFLIWFEVGRVELLRQLGFQYSEMEKQANCHLPVADLHIRYKSPARYDDEIVVKTGLQRVSRSLLHFVYEIVRESDNVVLATGDSMHIVVDDKLVRTSLPEEYMRAFKKLKRNA
jgi:acyl-CoA thioester hydrolase